MMFKFTMGSLIVNNDDIMQQIAKYSIDLHVCTSFSISKSKIKLTGKYK